MLARKVPSPKQSGVAEPEPTDHKGIHVPTDTGTKKAVSIVNDAHGTDPLGSHNREEVQISTFHIMKNAEVVSCLASALIPE